MSELVERPVVLFLCTGNSARSQMAEALLRRLTIQALNEIGIDASAQRAKGVLEYLGRLPVRHLVVVCTGADQKCPTIWPGVRNRHFWPFEDPAACAGTEAEKLDKFREVRDQIEARIKEWLAEQPECAEPAVCES